jgi:hypothetical protein
MDHSTNPAHCDRPGGRLCHRVGYSDGQGNSGPEPSRHNPEPCTGGDDATDGRRTAIACF